MVNEKEITVRYFGSQSAEDLYRCVESGAVFARQPCDDKCVRWLTTSKWRGGYEASCPLREGVIIHVVDNAGNLLFCETVKKADGYMDTVAEKAGPFSYEAIEALATDIAQRFNLASYYDWENWLLKDAEAAGYDGYYDNWLYDAEYEAPVKIAKMDFLGASVYVISQRAKHRKCGKIWTDYEIRTVDLSTCVAICGCIIEKEEQ